MEGNTRNYILKFDNTLSIHLDQDEYIFGDDNLIVDTYVDKWYVMSGNQFSDLLKLFYTKCSN